MSQQQNQQQSQQLYNAKAIKDTIDFIAKVYEDDSYIAIPGFGDEVFGYLEEHFIILQRLTALGVKISPEPSEYEILLQYLHILINSGGKIYDVDAAMNSSRIYNRDVLRRIDASRDAAWELYRQKL